MKRVLCIFLPLILSSPTFAHADVQVAARFVPDAKVVGQARYKYLIWSVFDAQLYAPSGRWSSDAPFALTLTYLRNISGKLISKSSVGEIRKQGFADEAKLISWQKKLDAIMPNVKANSRITGVKDKEGSTRFFYNGKAIGVVKDAQFTQQFFNIWLGRKASDGSFRRRLLGNSG